MALKPIFQRVKPNSEMVQLTPYAYTETGERVENPVVPGHYFTVREKDARGMGAAIEECASNTAVGRLPRTTFQSSETDAINFTVDMTGVGVEAGAVYVRNLGLSALMAATAIVGQAVEDKDAGGVVTHYNHKNSFDMVNALANREGVELQDIYVEVGDNSVMRNYPPEEYSFDLKGRRIISSMDKKKFQDATAQDTNKNVLRIDSNRCHLNGLRTLVIRVPKGEKVTFRIKFKTSF